MQPERTALRIAICQDVINTLKGNASFIPACGVYIGMDSDLIREYGEMPIKKNFNTVAPKCRACALGAMMLAFVHIKNEFTVYQLNRTYWEQMRDHLDVAFTEQELVLIESYYEGWDDDEKYRQGFDFSTKANGEVMMAIMQDIIDNNGEIPHESEQESVHDQEN